MKMLTFPVAFNTATDVPAKCIADCLTNDPNHRFAGVTAGSREAIQ